MGDSRREPPIGFKRSLVSFFFNHPESRSNISEIIGGFEQQGYNLDQFYWMDSSLSASREDIRDILISEHTYLTTEEIERYLENYVA